MNLHLFFDALKKVMPDLMNRLNPPATDEQIDSLKAGYDFEIDPLYIDFLRTCNGEKDTLMMGFGSWIIDTERAKCYHNTEWMDWHSLADNPHLCKDQYYSKKRVPIMEDGGGSSWFMDYDPAPEGKMGQIVCVFRDQPEIVLNCFDSFEDLLLTIIEEVDKGRVSLDESMNSFIFRNYDVGYNYFANKSATYHKNTLTVPTDFFTSLSPEWLAAVSNATHNPIINRDGITATPQEALAVKEIDIRDPKMMDSFVEVMQYLPNVQFLEICKDVELTDAHYKIIKKLRLHRLAIGCPVRHIAKLTDKNALRSLSLLRMYDADINEIAVYKNLIKLDIQRKNDSPSLAFLPKMKRVEELQLWHEELTIVKLEDVEAISKMPKLSCIMAFKTKPTNFDKLIARPRPFYSSFNEAIDFVR
jgi:cell wall assembly regulator SMI1